jgi:hypothetical protein
VTPPVKENDDVDAMRGLMDTSIYDSGGQIPDGYVV